MKSILVLSLMMAIGVAGAPLTAMAAGDHGAAHGGHGGHAKTSASEAAMTDGEIRKVDKSAGKITIKHGELKNLDMGPMTMIFRVTDKTMLDKVKPGDKVRFIADKIDGKLTVTQLDPAQ